jgi:alpha-tubulin suppressor-like RCC1 family protein
MTTIPARGCRIPSLPVVALAMLAGCSGGGLDCPPGGAPCGTSYDVTSPAAVSSSQTFASISIGNWHTCMTSINGAAWCWGSNDKGQLGAVSAQRCMGGNIDCSTVPLAVGGMLAFVGIASSSVHSCGLTAGGAAWCWGIAAQLGDGGSGGDAVRVPVAVAGGHRFTKIVASTSAPMTCAFAADGSPWCWGSGFGFGTKGPTSSATPLRWDAIANVVWTQFAIGQGHACGLDAAGKAWCVGSAANGLLGDGSGVASATPVGVAGGHVFQEIVAAIEHTCALAVDGQAWCWGQGAGLGNGGPVGTVQPTPVAVAGGLHFVHLAAGNGRTCGLATDGGAWCWGEGYGGNLGDGTTDQRLTPVAVAGGHHFVALGGGGISTCGIDTAGKAWCWGSNETGAVGVPMP